MESQILTLEAIRNESEQKYQKILRAYHLQEDQIKSKDDINMLCQERIENKEQELKQVKKVLLRDRIIGVAIIAGLILIIF